MRRITYVSSIDGKPATKKFPETRLGAMRAEEAWRSLTGPSNFTMFAVYVDGAAPTRYWWKPGGFNGQAIGHHEAGAKAFRDVLAKHNIVGTTGSRYD